MNNMPLKLRRELAEDPFYKVCARKSAECDGRITWEHALEYAGRQIQARFAIIPLCWYHHLGAGMNKRINQQIAYGRASDEDKKNYPRIKWGALNPNHNPRLL